MCYGLWETSLRRVFFGPLPSAKPEGFTLAPNQRILAEWRGHFCCSQGKQARPDLIQQRREQNANGSSNNPSNLCVVLAVTECISHACDTFAPSTNICIHWAQDGTGFHHPAKKTGKSVKTNANAQQYSADGDKQYYLHVKELEHLKIAQSSAVPSWHSETIRAKGRSQNRAVLQCRCNRSSSSFGHSQIHSIRTGTGIFHRSRLCIWEQLNFTSLWPSSAPAGMYEKKFKSSSFSMVPWRKLSYVRCAMSWSSQWSGKWQIVVITSKYFTTMLKFPDSKACKTVPFICAP